MTFFKNIVIVKSFTYEGNEYFLKECSQRDVNNVSKDAKKDGEKIMFDMWSLMVCDKSGKLLEMSKDDIEGIPMGLRKDIINNILLLTTGQKKS